MKLDWKIFILGAVLTALGLAVVVLGESSISRNFLIGARTEAGLMLAAGITLSVVGVLKGHLPEVGTRGVSLAALLVFGALYGSATIVITPNIILGGSALPGQVFPWSVKTVDVRVVGGPPSQAGDFYLPERITVVIGVNNTVTWKNVDVSHHTVTGPDRSFESGNINPDGSYTHTFTSAGEYAYVCDYHPWMKATVVVKNG